MTPRTTLRTVAALIAAALFASAAVPALAATPQSIPRVEQGSRSVPPANSLLTVVVDAGSLTRTGPGRYTLAVTPQNGRVTWFSDRPERLAGHLTASRLVALWPQFGFAEVPPESALVTDTPRGQVSQVLELRNPRWKGGQLVFDARLRGGARMPEAFTNASLFIDGTAACPTLTSAQQQVVALFTQWGQVQVQVEPILLQATSPEYGMVKALSEYLPSWIASVNQMTSVGALVSQLAGGTSLPFEIQSLQSAPVPALAPQIASLQQINANLNALLGSWQGC